MIVDGGLKSIFKDITRSISNALFPEICISCNAFIKRETWTDTRQDHGSDQNLKNETAEGIFKALMSPHLCHACMDDFDAVRSPMCRRCGRPFRSRAGEDRLCGKCLSPDSPDGMAAEAPFISARACGVYSGALKDMISAYKYREKTGLGRPLGSLLYIFFLAHYADAGIDFIIPVPLHRKKLVKRGFNQAMEMLRRWPWSKTAWGKQLPSGAILRDDLLVRVKKTSPQTGLNRKQRGDNVKNAFAIPNAAPIENKRVLLIDDVLTTGATLGECAAALKKAGAAGVYFLTLARAE